MSYFGIPLRNGVGLGIGSTTGLRNAAINAGASLSLNFQSGTLDSRVTFSRTSNATLTGSDGLIQYAPNNLLTYSEQFDNAVWTKSNSAITANAAIAPDGTMTADLLYPLTTGSDRRVLTAVVLSAVPYTVSAYIKASGKSWAYMLVPQANTINDVVWFDLTNGVVGTIGSSATAASIQSMGDGWFRCVVTGLGDAASAYSINVADANGSTTVTASGTSGIYIWGAQLNTGSLQPYYATTSSAYYGPRFDYDPVTLAPKGLLIEEQRTNLLTYSEQFNDAAWAKTNMTVTANSSISPDGTLSADTLTSVSYPSTSASRSQTLTAVQHTYSVYAKASSLSSLRLDLVTAGYALGSHCIFNLSTQATTITNYGATTGTTAAVVLVGNGWFRCVLTVTATAATWFAQTYGAGDGSIFVWGAQLEAGAFASSYIPTVASQVTRSADNASMTGTNFSSWYNASEGTFQVSFSTLFTSLATVSCGLIGFDNSAAKRIVYISNGSNNAANYDGTNTLTSSSVVTTAPSKVASAYDSTNKYIVANNGTVASGSMVSAYPISTSLDIGKYASNVANSTIKQITYYPRRLTNAELQAITS